MEKQFQFEKKMIKMERTKRSNLSSNQKEALETAVSKAACLKRGMHKLDSSYNPAVRGLIALTCNGFQSPE
jgi:hypothetical protein